MKRKGDISINMIVVAVIALVVLLSVILIFNSRMKVAAGGLSDCESRNGVCQPSCNSEKHISLDLDCENNEKCCVPIIGS